MTSLTKKYEEETNKQFSVAVNAISVCSCGVTPELIFPLYTTQICTYVQCECRRMAHGDPENPMSAVVAWNAKVIEAQRGAT